MKFVIDVKYKVEEMKEQVDYQYLLSKTILALLLVEDAHT